MILSKRTLEHKMSNLRQVSIPEALKICDGQLITVAGQRGAYSVMFTTQEYEKHTAEALVFVNQYEATPKVGLDKMVYRAQKLEIKISKMSSNNEGAQLMKEFYVVVAALSVLDSLLGVTNFDFTVFNHTDQLVASVSTKH